MKVWQAVMLTEVLSTHMTREGALAALAAERADEIAWRVEAGWYDLATATEVVDGHFTFEVNEMEVLD